MSKICTYMYICILCHYVQPRLTIYANRHIMIIITCISSDVMNPVLGRPSMEQRLEHRINTPRLQSMYIMADLHHIVEGSVDQK